MLLGMHFYVSAYSGNSVHIVQGLRWPSFQHFFADWKTVSLNFELKGQLFSLFLRPNIYRLSKFNLNLNHVFFSIVRIEMKSGMNLTVSLFFVGFFSSSQVRLKPNQSKSWGFLQ